MSTSASSRLAPGASLRLHLNENTAGCSPAVLDALRAIDRDDVSYYPDYSGVTAACERWFGVASGWVQLTNGLDEGLHVAAQWAQRAQRTEQPADIVAVPANVVIIVEPAFEMYAACADAAGLRALHIPPEADFRFPLEALLAAISDATRLIYLTDPNNPTGLDIPPGAVEEIAAAAPRALVLVDEAYADFSGRTLIGPALDRHRNVVVGRTFAKGHGLAALRIGALVAHPETIDRLRPLLSPFSINICAVHALQAALADRAHLDWYVAQSAASRALIYGFSRRQGWQTWTSEANFVLVRVGEAAPALVAGLAARGILIRDPSSQPGCHGCVRITAGTVEATEACLRAIEDVLAAAPID